MKFKWIPLGFLTVLAVSSLAFTEHPPARPGGPINLGDTAWLLTASGLVLLMTPGLSFFYAGMVSTKNVISTMLQSFIALGVIINLGPDQPSGIEAYAWLRHPVTRSTLSGGTASRGYWRQEVLNSRLWRSPAVMARPARCRRILPVDE